MRKIKTDKDIKEIVNEIIEKYGQLRIKQNRKRNISNSTGN